MAVHFADLGFDLDEYDFLDELAAFAEDNAAAAQTVTYPGGSCLKIPVDGCLELWFPMGEDGIIYEGVQPHYHGGSEAELKSPMAVDTDENGMSGMVKVMHGDAYPMNLNIPCMGLLPELGGRESLKLELAAFAEEADLYEDEADFNENCIYGEGFAVRSFIPTGCYAAFGNDDVAETPRAMMTGIITAAEKCSNSYTGLDYYRLTVDTLDASYTVLAAEELFYGEPTAGNVIMGKFWFSGNITE